MTRIFGRFLPIIAAVLLFPAMAANAALISADVNISSTHNPIFTGGGYVDFSYSATGQGPGATASGAGCNGNNAVDPCSFNFLLSTTGFSFTEACQHAGACNFPDVVVTLTNMLFTGGENLVGAGLTETPNGPPPLV